MDLGWKLRRLAQLAERIKGSLAIRGWRGTLKRAVRSRHVVAAMPAVVAVRPPAPGHAPRRILVIESMTPDPSRDSGSVRLSHIFSLLNADGWDITFIADDGDATPADAARLGALGVAVVSGNPLAWLRRDGASLDAVMLCRLPVASQYIDVVKRLAPQARVVFDTVDLHFIRERRAADLTGNRSLLRKALRSRDRELAMVARCDVTLVVSEDERRVLAHESPGAHVELVSNIHEVHGRSRGFTGREGMLFVGGFGHPPNEDAVRWFIAEILPLVRAAMPGAQLHVAGDIDAAARRSIEGAGVVVHGRVPDLAPLHASTLVSVAPLRFGAGVKGKVNQAMSHGLPVVLTSIAAEGMHLRHGMDAMVADEAGAFADAIVQIARDEAAWVALSDAGTDNIRRYFSGDNARAALRRALEPHTC